MKWLLVASLALNLLIAGALAGAWLHRHGDGPLRWAGGPSDFGLMFFSRSLPDERREAVRKILREGKSGIKSRKAEITALQTAAAEALAAPDFTPEKFRETIAAIGGSEERRRKASVDVLLKVIEILTPEERQRLAEMWKKRLERETRRQKRRKGDDEPLGP